MNKSHDVKLRAYTTNGFDCVCVVLWVFVLLGGVLSLYLLRLNITGSFGVLDNNALMLSRFVGFCCSS